MQAFDRDGVLVGELGDFAGCDPQFCSPRKLITPVCDHVRGTGAIVCSNQGGIGRYKTLEQVAEEFLWLQEELGLLAAFFAASPDHCYIAHDGLVWEIGREFPEFVGSYRKPGGGMLLLAQKLFGPIDYYVGDCSGSPNYADGRDSDLQAAIAAGVDYLDVQDFLFLPCTSTKGVLSWRCQSKGANNEDNKSLKTTSCEVAGHLASRNEACLPAFRV